MTENLNTQEKDALAALLKKQNQKPEPKPKESKAEKVQGLTAQYEIIEIKDGFNIHKLLEEPLSKRSYEKERFLIKRSFLDKIRHRIRFLVVFKSPAKEGGEPILVSLSDPVEISSRLLYTVKTSKTLRNALVSLFRKPFSFGGFGGKKIMFIGVIIVVCVVGYLIYSGQLNLGGLIHT